MSFHQEADPYFEDEYEDSETYIEIHEWEDDDDLDDDGGFDDLDWWDEDEDIDDDELCPGCHCSKCECDQQPPPEPHIPNPDDAGYIPF